MQAGLMSALTSIAATLGAALSSRGEQTLVPGAGERGAGASAAGYAPSGANTRGAGRRTPLAVVLWVPEKQRDRQSHIETQPAGEKKRGRSRETAGLREAALLSEDERTLYA